MTPERKAQLREVARVNDQTKPTMRGLIEALDALDAAEQRLQAAEADTARKCAKIAMERGRLLNGDAVAQIRLGRFEMASATERKADQFEWMENAIYREFGLKELPATKGAK